jgi:hypothetical protein
MILNILWPSIFLALAGDNEGQREVMVDGLDRAALSSPPPVFGGADEW